MVQTKESGAERSQYQALEEPDLPEGKGKLLPDQGTERQRCAVFCGSDVQAKSGEFFRGLHRGFIGKILFDGKKGVPVFSFFHIIIGPPVCEW